MRGLPGKIVTALGLAALVFLAAAAGQDATSRRLIDGQPYDLLTLDKANDNKVIKVEPLDLPERKAPEKPKAGDKVRITLADGGEQYEVAWLTIDKLDARYRRQDLCCRFHDAHRAGVAMKRDPHRHRSAEQRA